MILEYGLYISSPGWWHEDEFLLHLVGGMSGKLPNDIEYELYISSPGWWYEKEYGLVKESTGCTFHHLVGGMKMSSFFTWLVA
ncbi:hypothetical protein FF1_006426 [Malus domestica]